MSPGRGLAFDGGPVERPLLLLAKEFTPRTDLKQALSQNFKLGKISDGLERLLLSLGWGFAELPAPLADYQAPCSFCAHFVKNR